ncbi:MAG: 50S ribosomal protein L11 methyltransferase [Desulfobacterales bacterium]
MASDLISEIFYDFGLQGVIVESPGTESGIDWAENDITVHTEHAVIGYFPKNGQLAERCRMLEEKLNLLHQSFQINWRHYHDIDEQDWALVEAVFFHGKITDTIVIKPSWRTYRAGPEEIVLEIDPGMAFGFPAPTPLPACALP